MGFQKGNLQPCSTSQPISKMFADTYSSLENNGSKTLSLNKRRQKWAKLKTRSCLFSSKHRGVCHWMLPVHKCLPKVNNKGNETTSVNIIFLVPLMLALGRFLCRFSISISDPTKFSVRNLKQREHFRSSTCRNQRKKCKRLLFYGLIWFSAERYVCIALVTISSISWGVSLYRYK